MTSFLCDAFVIGLLAFVASVVLEKVSSTELSRLTEIGLVVFAAIVVRTIRKILEEEEP